MKPLEYSLEECKMIAQSRNYRMMSNDLLAQATKRAIDRRNGERADRGYRVEITALSEEDGGGFMATVPALPGCCTDGATPESARERVPEAIVSWAASSERMGQAVPTPDKDAAA